MAIYQIKALFDRLYELSQQGCQYIDVSTEESLKLKGVIDEHTLTDAKIVNSCQYGAAIDSGDDDDNCYEVSFTYDEMATIASALANMPSIYQKVIDDESYDPREREAFRTMCEKVIQLKTKIEQSFK